MGVEIDLKDRKILEQLDIDCRRSNARVSKKTGINKDSVGYRIGNLEKRNIVKGYYALLNIAKLGYVTYKIMLTFRNTTSETESEMTGYLKSDKRVGWLVSCDGYYNLMAVTWVKSSAEFDNFFKEFLKKYSENVKERDILLITENHSCRKAYLFGKIQDETPDTYYGGEAGVSVDKTDLEITKLLANNSRIKLTEVSKRIGLTSEAVAHRIRQLKKKNIIQAFRPVIDTYLLGYQYYNVIFRLKKFDNTKKIFAFFKQQPNIIYFVRYLGSFDVGIDLEVRDVSELREIMKQIKDQFSDDIESYNSILVYKDHKLSYLPE